jgi:hypothetical protein
MGRHFGQTSRIYRKKNRNRFLLGPTLGAGLRVHDEDIRLFKIPRHRLAPGGW